ncbi:MAG: Gfo/Idh/MocA family oxidoreductase [Opitutaceae bacterium]|nr:Gfo/Idh/MocA family oxidoreductase [Opitutaceae bacterium]
MPSSLPPSPGHLTRRTILQRGLTGIFASALAPNFLPASLFGKTAPSNRITVGMIGNGLICSAHVGTLTGNSDCRIIAVCDVARSKAQKMRDRVERAYGDKASGTAARGVDLFTRHEELLARDDIDAVFVCTPDHWHAAVAKAAMLAGKDVYCEKPLTLTIREGRVLVNTARRHGRILQTGTQQRSNRSFRHAAELVRNGLIGDIRVVRTRLGEFPPVPALPEEPVPAGFDYDRWLGPTPWRPYNEKRVLGNYGGGWRCFYEYGGRKNGDWGAHHFDIIQWALGMDDSGPVEFIPKGYQGTPYQTHVYANGIRVERNDDPNSKAMIEFVGSKGTVWVSRNDFLETDPPALATRPLRPDEVHLYVSDDHEADFFSAMRTRQRPIADVEIGHRSATTCHLNVIAEHVGRPVRWDPRAEEIIGDPVAARLLDRPRRAPYAL